MLRLHELLGSRHIKVVRLSALGTGRFYPTGDSGEMDTISFLQRLRKIRDRKATNVLKKYDREDGHCAYKSNTETHSCNHCYSGKAISVTYSKRVFVD